MIIRSKKFKSEGLIREAVKYGFGDLRIKVENEEIITFKYILYVCNETFRKLLKDPLFEEPLVLSEDCSKDSFLLLERYYEGMDIEINEKNCVDLLSMCVCYNEENIMSDVAEYIINHLNGCIVVDLINKREILENRNLKELKYKFEDFIKTQNYKLMRNEFLNNLRIDSVKYLFSDGIIFSGNEMDLLRLLLEYNKNNIRDIRDKNEMRKLILRCNFKDEVLKDLNEDYENIMNNIGTAIDEDEDENENENYSIRYYTIPKIQNEILFDILMKYYPSEDVQDISFESIYIYIYIYIKDISEDIDVLLKNNEIKVLILVLELCDSLKIKFDITKRLNILDVFLDYYKIVNDVKKREIIFKRMTEFISEENSGKLFLRMKEKNGTKLLFNLLRDKSLLNENRSKLLFDYFHTLRLNKKEYKLLNSIIEDETTKRKIMYHELKEISYPKMIPLGCTCVCSNDDNHEFTIGEKVNLIPHINDIVDVEEITIKPDLPPGILLDRKTGVISGILNEEYTNRFTIKAKNLWNVVATEFHLTIVDSIVYSYIII